MVAEDNLKLHLNAAKSFAYYGTKLYRAKQDANNNPTNPTNFNITMGSFDGAEVCELVGLYLLHKLVQKGIFKREHVGLYRDDGLAVVEVKRGQLKDYNDKMKLVHKAVYQ